MIAFAFMLFAAALAAWIVIGDAPPRVRAYVGLACMLYAALAAASAVNDGLADSVALIVASVAPTLLASAARPHAAASAALALIVASLAGMAAAATGIVLFAFVPLLAAAIVFAGARRTVQACAASVAMASGAAAFVAGGAPAHPALMAFWSAGILGAALALAPSQAAVEKHRRHGPRRAVASRRGD